MKKLILAIIIFLIGSSKVGAVGDYFMLTDLGTSAKTIRIGNIEGFSQYPNTVFENPAGLHRTNKIAVSAFTTTLMEEVEYKNIAVSMRLPVGILGVGYMSAQVADIPHTFINESKGNEFDIDGYYNYINSLTKISYCISQSKELHIGASVSHYYTDVYSYKGEGYNFDAGILIETDTLALSIIVKNAAPNLVVNYENSEDANYSGLENLPLQTIYSIRYNLSDFQLYGQLKNGNRRQMTSSVGINYTPSFIPFFSISAGYKELLVLEEVKNNFTLGLGLNLFGVSFDYAYEQSEHILYNHKHYFSLGIGI
jgi:hypothetical protein